MEKEHIVWIDYVKCVCLLLVILYHSKDVWEASILTSILSLCIPPFFMINGWLMLRKERTYGALIRKAVKIWVLTTIWAVLNGISVQLYQGDEFSFTKILGWVTSRSHDGYCHTLWFMDTLLILTLLCPMVHFLLQKTEDKLRRIFLFIFLVFVTFIPKVGYHLHLSFLDGWMSYSLAYFVGGWLLLGNVIDLSKIKVWMLFLIAGLSMCLQWEYVYIMLNKLSSVNNILGLVQDTVFSGYRSPFTLITSFTLMAIVCRFPLKNNAVIRFVGTYSLGIYLLEGIARKIILYVCPMAENLIVFKTLGTFVLAAMITWIFSKNKVTLRLIKI